MKVKNIGSNMTELELNGNTILFSYETPVAAHTSNGTIKTSKKWSVTTSKHINKWLERHNLKGCEKLVNQEVLDNLLR